MAGIAGGLDFIRTSFRAGRKYLAIIDDFDKGRDDRNMKRYKLVCGQCHEEYERDYYQCPKCGGTLHTVYQWKDIDEIKKTIKTASCYWDYQPCFTVERESRKVTMGEGFTPCIHAENLGDCLGIEKLYIKNESVNPSSTFKDRCMSISFSKALESGADAVVIGSAGNAGAAAAAYSARAGITCYVMVPANTSIQRIAQIQNYGAKVITVKGSVTDCIDLIGKVYKKYGWHNVTTASRYNPFQADAEKAIAYEMAKQMDWKVPDWIAVPVGGGGILSGIYRGYKDMLELGLISRLPRMIGTQEEGCNPLVRAFSCRVSPAQIEKVENPQGVAVAIADAFPLDGETALAAIYDSDGWAEDASDEEIMEAQALIGRNEGIFAETASSTTVACVKKMKEQKLIKDGETVACVITGNGMKELSLLASRGIAPVPIDADVKELDELLKKSF